MEKREGGEWFLCSIRGFSAFLIFFSGKMFSNIPDERCPGPIGSPLRLSGLADARVIRSVLRFCLACRRYVFHLCSCLAHRRVGCSSA